MAEFNGTTLPNLPLTDAHLRAIVAAVRAGTGRQPSKAEVERVVRWIERICTDAAVVEGILTGAMAARFPAGGELRLSLTPSGEARVEELLKHG